MSVIDWIKARLTGVISTGGTLLAAGEYPVVISSDVAGGHQSFYDLPELAAFPVEKMAPGMSVTVLSHTSPAGKFVPRRKYTLTTVPSQKISTITDYKLSDYWRAHTVEAVKVAGEIRQYAASYQGGMPLFGAMQISNTAYQAGFATSAQTNRIWVDTYDPAVHDYVRVKAVSGNDYGAPYPLHGGLPSIEYYTDYIFLWQASATAAPVITSQDKLPAGWSAAPFLPGTTGNEADYDTTYQAYIASNSLYMSKARKSRYNDVVLEWEPVMKISTDPALVRYSRTADSEDFTNESFWQSYYLPGVHSYQARRKVNTDTFQVSLIDLYTQSYLDFVYKEFTADYVVTSADIPATYLGYGSDGWQQLPFIPQAGYVLYEAACRKIIGKKGRLFRGWSTPYKTQQTGRTFLYSDKVSPVTFPANITKQQVLNNQGGVYNTDWKESSVNAVWRREYVNGTWEEAYRVKGDTGATGATSGILIAVAYSSTNEPLPTGKRAENNTLLPVEEAWQDTPPIGGLFYRTRAIFTVNRAVVGAGEPSLTDLTHWTLINWSAPKRHDHRGPQGAQGVQGPAGPKGDTGLAGIGVNWKGTWNSATAYAAADAVSHNGSSWIANATATNQEPGAPSVTVWDPWVSKGAQGSAGAAGATLRNGTGVPSNALGVNNDYYLNTSNNDLYKRVNGVYVLQGNFTGAAGATGAAGKDGITAYTTITSLTGIALTSGQLAYRFKRVVGTSEATSESLTLGVQEPAWVNIHFQVYNNDSVSMTIPVPTGWYVSDGIMDAAQANYASSTITVYAGGKLEGDIENDGTNISLKIETRGTVA